MMPVAESPGNHSNSCSTDRGTLSQAATVASICLVLVLGLLLNSLALWVFCCRLRRWTETRIYMVNLVVADCLLLLSLPGILHTLSQRVGASEGPLCRVLQSFYYVNTYMSMWLLTAIAADRYAALHFPLRARAWRGPRQAALTCAALWLLVVGAVALPVAWLHPGESFCFGRGHTRGPRALIFSLLLFFLPLLILSFCSGRVLQRLHREWTRAQPQATTPILKALCVVTANLATFMLCFLPLHVAQWVHAACPTIQRVATFVQVASRIANANCCLDAVCYYFMATEFQEEVGPSSPGPGLSGEECGEFLPVAIPTWAPRGRQRRRAAQEWAPAQPCSMRRGASRPPRNHSLPAATVSARSSLPECSLTWVRARNDGSRSQGFASANRI